MPLTVFKTSTPHVPSEKFIRGPARFLYRDDPKDIETDYGYRYKFRHTDTVWKMITKESYECINGWENMGATKVGYLLKSDGYSSTVETTLFDILNIPRSCHYEMAIVTMNPNKTLNTFYTTVHGAKFVTLSGTQLHYKCEFELGMTLGMFKEE